MNHTCLCLPSRRWYSFTDFAGMEGWVGLGWLVGYIPKWVSGTGNWTRTRSSISVLLPCFRKIWSLNLMAKSESWPEVQLIAVSFLRMRISNLVISFADYCWICRQLMPLKPRMTGATSRRPSSCNAVRIVCPAH